jgi:hypothetical protein
MNEQKLAAVTAVHTNHLDDIYVKRMYIDAPSEVTDVQPDDLTDPIWLAFE